MGHATAVRPAAGPGAGCDRGPACAPTATRGAAAPTSRTYTARLCSRHTGGGASTSRAPCTAGPVGGATRTRPTLCAQTTKPSTGKELRGSPCKGRIGPRASAVWEPGASGQHAGGVSRTSRSRGARTPAQTARGRYRGLPVTPLVAPGSYGGCPVSARWRQGPTTRPTPTCRR